VITLQGASKFLGKKELFKDVSFHVHPGDRIGLIGSNGVGKTTLFHVLLGETEPDTGTISKFKSLRMGYLPQHWVPSETKTVLVYVMDVHEELNIVQEDLRSVQKELDNEKETKRIEALALRQTQLLERLEHLGGYDLEARARKILAGLGFRDDHLDRSVSTLSGGWVMRSALARLLLAEPDLLLLDEPTNHLDLDSLLWLEQYLLTTSSAMILIAHDRMFLNRVVQRILELEQGTLHEYTGSYDDYEEEKARRREIHLASYKNQQERIRQMERFIERNRYRKDRARQVQSRIKQMEKIERIELPEHQTTIHFSFPEPPRSGKRVIELKNVQKAYGDHVVYAGIDCVVERGDRIAFLGPNGAGKSTLLKILAGVTDINGGERVLGHQTCVGYYAQHQWEQLHDHWTALEEVSSVSGNLPQSQLRGFLGAFLFRGDDVLKKVSVLSGGEKARLTLCKLLLQRPNVLLLDEPTNHLDIESRDVLERALKGFPGTIASISHDRHFINAIANKTLVVTSGQIHIFPGNYDDYQNIWKERLTEDGIEKVNDSDSRQERISQASPKRKDQERKRVEAEWRNELYRLKQPLQKHLDQLEQVLEEVHNRLDAFNAQLADPNTYQDGSHVQELKKKHQQCQEKIEKLTEEWEEKALVLEELEENFWQDKETEWEKRYEGGFSGTFSA
jgi:ATP-binding cassette subfamily F protein 3